MLSTLNQLLSSVNNSKFLAGIIMILLNIGSKYVEMGFSKTQEQALRNGLAREILIFAIIFTGTRDIVISILMTAAFIILSSYLLNDKSKYCLIPDKLHKISLQMDTNKDGYISDEEEKNALEILRKAELQKTRNQQKNFMNYMVVNKL